MRNEEKYLTRLTEFEIDLIMSDMREILQLECDVDTIIKVANLYQKLQKDKEYYDKLEEEICI